MCTGCITDKRTSKTFEVSEERHTLFGLQKQSLNMYGYRVLISSLFVLPLSPSSPLSLRIQSLSTMYVILLRWNEIEKYATDHQILWPYDQTKALDAYEAFSTIFINDANATILSESGTNLTWLKSKCCE